MPGARSTGSAAGTAWTRLSKRHLGHTTLTFKDICGSGKKQIPFGEVPLDARDRNTRPRMPT